ncbi:MAG: hypothetical protein EOP92_43575 [Lysobacteraceae bacterium]|jgi:hypothetical protein|nr:MAG: hypothetical protein EOP92_43575 [Xanthomonadaceae bacterium]
MERLGCHARQRAVQLQRGGSGAGGTALRPPSGNGLPAASTIIAFARAMPGDSAVSLWQTCELRRMCGGPALVLSGKGGH